MRGYYTSEQANHFVAQQLKINEKELWRDFVQQSHNFTIPQQRLNMIKTLREKYYVVLLTDNMDSFDRFISPSPKLTKYFDEIINSYNTGILKKDKNREIFLTTIQKLSRDIHHAIFLDNNLKNCTLFEHLGGTSYHIINNIDDILKIL